MERLEAFFTSRHAPMRLMLSPFAAPSAGAWLLGCGYTAREDVHAMFRGVSAVDASPAASHVEVRLARTEEADTWATVVTEGFADGHPPSDDSRGLFLAWTNVPATGCYLALLGGEPVGGGAVTIHGSHAGFHATSTLEAFRGRGVHAALLAARLAHAARAGCALASVGARPGSASERNAVRAGFRTAFTRADMAR